MHETHAQIRTAVKERYAKVACSPHEQHPFAIGPERAKALGYDAADIDALPAKVTESFAGVGNPLALGELRVGDTVLDLGSGAGMDCILVAQRVGRSGKVIGVDMTEEMVRKARTNALAAAVADVQFYVAEADVLPVNDAEVDVVISNGVFNLCLDKPKVLSQVFRILKPGGRIQMADMLLEDGVTPEEVAQKGAWSNCIAGTVWGRTLLQMLSAAGFVDAKIHGWTGYRTSPCTQGALVTARKPLAGVN